MRFSVVIPTYNRKRWLFECLQSVFRQSYQPIEVIVVDDGSTDGTLEALSASHYPIVALRQANRGPGAARNFGAREAKGDYLAFLDSDDLWFPWTLETFAVLLKQYRQPSLLFGRYNDFREPGDLTSVVFDDPVGDQFHDFLASHSKGYFCGAGMMVVSKEAFVETSGFAEDFLNAEDHDLALQLGTTRGFVQVLSPTTIGHRIHDNNEMGDVEKTLRGLERIVSKERAGHYPGGFERRVHRQEIIARHTRSAVTSAIRSGYVREALPLYKATSSWNLMLGRFPYLAAAPFLALASILGPKRGGR